MNYQLMIEANKLYDLGYTVGLAQGKSLLGQFIKGSKSNPDNYDGISIILDDIVCVDFDTDLHMDVGWGNNLPPTLKEKSPRGFHLFYLLPAHALTKRETKVKWKEHVDLLTKGKTMRTPRYGSNNTTASAHVLMSPSPGYRRIYPDVTPPKDALPLAPDWLIQAIKP